MEATVELAAVSGLDPSLTEGDYGLGMFNRTNQGQIRIFVYCDRLH